MRLIPLHCVIFAALANGGPAKASHLQEKDPWPVALQEQLVAIDTINWRLRTAIRPICPNREFASGVLFDSLYNYAPTDRAFVKSLTGMGEFASVLAIGTESEGANAGLLPGDEVIRVRGALLPLPPQADEAPVDASGLLERQITSGGSGPVELLIRRAGEDIALSLGLEEICAGVTTLVVDDDTRAYSDLENIAITSGLVALAANEHELAFAIGHELAHTIYEDSNKNGLSRRRKERRADLFAAFALRCAGYDPLIGQQIIARVDSRSLAGFFGSLSHGSARGRRKAVEAFEDNLDCSDPASLEAITQKARS